MSNASIPNSIPLPSVPSQVKISYINLVNNLGFFLGIIILQGYVFYVWRDGFFDMDSFYHIAMAKGLFESRDFTWLPYSIYGNHFPPRHYLFQFFLYPFLQLGDYWGSRTYLLGIIILLAVIYYQLFTALHSNYPRLWTLLLLFGSPLFCYRLNQIRPISLAIVLMGFYLLGLLRERKGYCFLSGCIFSLAYTAYSLLFLNIFILAVLSLYFRNTRLLKISAYALLGILLGCLIHPFFPQNILTDIHYAGMKWAGISANYELGSEWFPLDAAALLLHLWVIVISAYLVIFVFYYHKFRYQCLRREFLLYTLCTAGVWLLMLLRAHRFIDYFYPSAILFLANWEGMMIQPDRIPHPRRYRQTQYLLRLSLLLIVVLSGYLTITYQTHLRPTDFKPLTRLHAAADWIRTNSCKGDMVVLSTMNSFPELVYHNRDNRYLLGMDWQYLFYYDESLAADYLEMLNRPYLSVSQFMIQYHFHILLLDHDDNFNENFYKKCLADADLIYLYQDRSASIFLLRTGQNEFSSSLAGNTGNKSSTIRSDTQPLPR